VLRGGGGGWHGRGEDALQGKINLVIMLSLGEVAAKIREIEKSREKCVADREKRRFLVVRPRWRSSRANKELGRGGERSG